METSKVIRKFYNKYTCLFIFKSFSYKNVLALFKMILEIAIGNYYIVPT